MTPMTGPEDVETLVEIAAQTGRLVAHVEYLNAFVRRLGNAAQHHDIGALEIPLNATTPDELADTLRLFVEVFEQVTPQVKILDELLPKAN
jgi:hypothetical protein